MVGSLRIHMATTILGGAIDRASRGQRQITNILRREGYRGIAQRMRRIAARQIAPRMPAWEVCPEDVIKADLTRPFLAAARDRRPGQPIAINWVLTPAGPGSGGHTTASRIIGHLQRNGFRNTVYLYDPLGGDHRYYAQIARMHYGIECPIRDLTDGIEDADAVFATSWPTAYAVFNARCAGRRFYFVQDYEPSFYPVGTNSVLAENTYRMGFHAITAGPWLAEKLSSDFGMAADHFQFGCDTDVYSLPRSSCRDGVAFYARAATPRRATEIGLLALRLLAQRMPDLKVHIFGEKVGAIAPGFIDHGQVDHRRLNDIYGRCHAGLSLSLTNTSLVPFEMLAAGCIPVVNDSRHNRMVLDNPHVVLAPPSPHQLADALAAVVASGDAEGRAAAAAGSIASRSWKGAAETVAEVVRRSIGAEG